MAKQSNLITTTHLKDSSEQMIITTRVDRVDSTSTNNRGDNKNLPLNSYEETKDDQNEADKQKDKL